MDKWNLIIKLGLCENCNNCVIAERDEHVGNDFPGYSAPAAAVGENTIRIQRRVQGAAPMVETTYMPVMCNHCDNAPCIRAASDAISKREDGIVLIDPVKAKGRREIVKSCPYGAIVWNEEQDVPQTWIFDAHLLDQGWTQPRCQQVCPTGVFEAVKLDDATMAQRAEKEGLKVLKPKMGTEPRVWYQGMDMWEKCFIGGSVSSFANQLVDCVEGAEVTLSRDDSVYDTATTNAFGEFRFDGLICDGGTWQIKVSHSSGSATASCSLTKSIYLGEIRLQ